MGVALSPRLSNGWWLEVTNAVIDNKPKVGGILQVTERTEETSISSLSYRLSDGRFEYGPVACAPEMAGMQMGCVLYVKNYDISMIVSILAGVNVPFVVLREGVVIYETADVFAGFVNFETYLFEPSQKSQPSQASMIPRSQAMSPIGPIPSKRRALKVGSVAWLATEAPIVSMKDLMPGMTNIALMVRVYRISEMTNTATAIYLSMVLVDEKGDAINITAFNDDIGKMRSVVKVGSVYRLVGFGVRPRNMAYTVGHTPHELTFGKDTKFMTKTIYAHILNEIQPHVRCDFVRMKAIVEATSSDKLDVIGIVYDMEDTMTQVRGKMRRHVWLKNQSGTVQVVLWHTLAEEFPEMMAKNGGNGRCVVLLHKAGVNIYPQGRLRTLQSAGCCLLIVNPIQYNANIEELRRWVDGGCVFDADYVHINPSTFQASPASQK